MAGSIFYVHVDAKSSSTAFQTVSTYTSELPASGATCEADYATGSRYTATREYDVGYQSCFGLQIEKW